MKAIFPLLTFRRAAVATAVLCLGGVLAAVHASQDPKPRIGLKVDDQPVHRGELERASFADVVKRVAPSVVKITTETKARRVAAGRGEMPWADDPFFRQFFGNRMPELRQPPTSGLGSGVIVSADGYIATNNHVVDGADVVNVALADGREFKAKVVGRDPQTDLAVIKIDESGLPAVTLADTDKVEVGDRVLAIGNPFGIGETVTSGIVSAKGRRVGILSEVQGYEDFIQTDAAINPGNSGGALVDVQGRLVGINTAILSRSGGFQGVGLAVPANLVSHVAESLVAKGTVVRGYLGVNIQNVTPALADMLKLKGREGALVAEVVADSPADEAGLKEGDVVTALNGQAVADANDLSLAVSKLAPGTKLELTVNRDGKQLELSAKAGERPGARRARTDDAQARRDDDEGVLNGVTVDDLSPAARRQFNLPARVRGAVITDVEPDSAAAKAGISPGDVILEINRQPVGSAEEAVELSRNAEGKKTLLRLWSRGGTIYVVVDETKSDRENS